MKYSILQISFNKCRDARGKIIPEYIIMNMYDGRFLEWHDICETGNKEIDDQIDCDGSLIVNSKKDARAIIKALGGALNE